LSHDPGCRHAGPHSDEARRCSDAINLHVTSLGWEATKKWVAVRLSDGGSDGTLYDSRRDAIRHQLHEQQCAYVCIHPGGMNPCQAESYLRMQRQTYDAGAHFVDPDHVAGGPEIIRRLTRSDQSAQMAAISSLRSPFRW
jgi:hypothetical protein